MLEQTTRFFLGLQAQYLAPEDRIKGRDLLQPAQRTLPRCQSPACGGLCTRRLTCSKCKQATYCSKECQRKHWSAGHKRECTVHSIGDGLMLEKIRWAEVEGLDEDAW